MRRHRLLVAVLLLLTGCSASTDSTEFELSEFAIVGPGQLSADSGSLTATNRGELPHTLVITNAEGDVMAATPLVQPGDAVSLDIDLAEGRYSFTCRIVAQDDTGKIVDHFEAGMTTTVSVGG